MSKRNGKLLTLWAFAVLLGERNVSVMVVYWSFVEPIYEYVYGKVIESFLDILDAVKELTFCVL